MTHFGDLGWKTDFGLKIAENRRFRFRKCRKINWAYSK